MTQEMMVLVCHATDGHFADGDRKAVRRILKSLANVRELTAERYELVCSDGGAFELRAPGLGGQRAFHRIELYLRCWTDDVSNIVFDLMDLGRFGLMDNLEQFFVTQPEQIIYFPWLPEPPLLVRSPRDLDWSLQHH